MKIDTEMGEALVAVSGQGLRHILKRADDEGRAAMADPGHMAELADRREPVKRAFRVTRRLQVNPRAVEMQNLMQPGLRLVPRLVARLGEMDADRDRSDLARRAVVAELLKEFDIFCVAAPGSGRQVITAPRRPGDALITHRSYPDRWAGLLHRGRRHSYIGK